jgi:hypothetical protein
MAAAVASAHNHVLRRWLRGESTDPIGEVDEAMRQVISLFTPRTPEPAAGGTTVIAFRAGQPRRPCFPRSGMRSKPRPSSGSGKC